MYTKNARFFIGKFPNMDKWRRWEKPIIELIKKVDYSFIEGTFFDPEELNNRPMSEVPHPFVLESILLFERLSNWERTTIYFNHFNYANPFLDEQSNESRQGEDAGYQIARFGMRFKL